MEYRVALLYLVIFTVYALEEENNGQQLDVMWRQYKVKIAFTIRRIPVENLHFRPFITYFQDRFNKTYVGLLETKRREAWEENLRKIHKHNDEAQKGLHSFTIRENHITDLVST